MGNRLDLQTRLETILGSRNVYYQPPESIQIKYPAIIYSRDKLDNRFANDKPYTSTISYEVIVIDKDPDSPIVKRVAELPLCKFVTNYIKDNLNHDVFSISLINN